MVRVRVYLRQVTVGAGLGTVWENPTRGIPVFNPTLPGTHEWVGYSQIGLTFGAD
jgi:hypothetical protein